MSHCYGYNSYSELLDAARKEREEKARQLEMADLKYRIRERENECFELRKHVQKLEQQKNWLAKKCEELFDDVENSFAPHHIPTKEWIERAEQATKEAKI